MPHAIALRVTPAAPPAVAGGGHPAGPRTEAIANAIGPMAAKRGRPSVQIRGQPAWCHRPGPRQRSSGAKSRASCLTTRERATVLGPTGCQLASVVCVGRPVPWACRPGSAPRPAPGVALLREAQPRGLRKTPYRPQGRHLTVHNSAGLWSSPRMRRKPSHISTRWCTFRRVPLQSSV